MSHTGTAEGLRPSPAAAEGEGARASSSPTRAPPMQTYQPAHLGAVETRSTARSGRGQALSTEPRRYLPRRSRTQISNTRCTGGGKRLHCIPARRAASQASSQHRRGRDRRTCTFRAAHTAPHRVKDPRTARAGLRTQGTTHGIKTVCIGDRMQAGEAVYTALPPRATQARIDPPPPHPSHHVPVSALHPSPCIANMILMRRPIRRSSIQQHCPGTTLPSRPSGGPPCPPTQQPRCAPIASPRGGSAPERRAPPSGRAGGLWTRSGSLRRQSTPIHTAGSEHIRNTSGTHLEV
jgi:hypothetical protein